jgi:hypothetical protein
MSTRGQASIRAANQREQMAKDLVIGSASKQRHSRILAALFCFYGFSHLAVASFFWVIILALAKEGYYELRTFAGVGMTLLVVATPLISAYALLRHRRWAQVATGVTCLVILIFIFIVLSRLVTPGLSVTRLLFAGLYAAASLAICIYGLWFVLVRPSSLRTR